MFAAPIAPILAIIGKIANGIQVVKAIWDMGNLLSPLKYVTF
ncbi:hypothetical protein [Spiroplasma endosymbiont of Ammophila pubescens]